MAADDYCRDVTFLGHFIRLCLDNGPRLPRNRPGTACNSDAYVGLSIAVRIRSRRLVN